VPSFHIRLGKRGHFQHNPARKKSWTNTRLSAMENFGCGLGLDADGAKKVIAQLRGRCLGGDCQASAGVSLRGCLAALYQTRQELTGYIGCPLEQPKALPNSSKFCTLPLVRQRPGECGSVSADCRAEGSVWFWHHTWAKPRK
jgi:hypothetical protein